jgi:hypothetical protein
MGRLNVRWYYPAWLQNDVCFTSRPSILKLPHSFTSYDGELSERPDYRSSSKNLTPLWKHASSIPISMDASSYPHETGMYREYQMDIFVGHSKQVALGLEVR